MPSSRRSQAPRRPSVRRCLDRSPSLHTSCFASAMSFHMSAAHNTLFSQTHRWFCRQRTTTEGADAFTCPNTSLARPNVVADLRWWSLHMPEARRINSRMRVESNAILIPPSVSVISTLQRKLKRNVHHAQRYTNRVQPL